MRYESRVVPVRPSIGPALAPAGMRVESLRDLALQVSGAFTGTFNAMGQAYDGGPWVQLIADITTPGWYSIPFVLFAFRLDTEAWTSSPEVALVGLNHRGE